MKASRAAARISRDEVYLTNAVKHGSRGSEDAVITCEVERTGAGLTLRIYDEGDGFSPQARTWTLSSAPAPTGTIMRTGFTGHDCASACDAIRVR